jgi:hypothetical protein
MVGFPFDDLKNWCGPYPPAVFAQQMEKVAVGWKSGLESLRMAVDRAPVSRREGAEEEWTVANAAYLYFQSVANQTRFVLARDALASATPPFSPDQQRQYVEKIHEIVRHELSLAQRMYSLTRLHSYIGYEAASQYFYLPLDLVEKAVNCQWILRNDRVLLRAGKDGT